MHTSRISQYAPMALLALTISAPLELCAASPATEKVIGNYVTPIASEGKYRVYMCDFCGDELDQRFKQLIGKTSYSGEWYVVDIPDGEVHRYTVYRSRERANIKEEPVDEETKKYIKTNQELFNTNNQSYDVNLTIKVDLPSK
ncbi:hypothetical protein DWU98_20850 [Dyella monticola]|uniref:Secreted protein n=1 Tax=Dyella monticola TaxID=1927958 RepID=A0A370WRT3_9GAMM|nr:hypothetical protein [Dyella monticola]RDS78820.1 hypothetical protein DWU98_20850 [Dyella monticola]